MHHVLMRDQPSPLDLCEAGGERVEGLIVDEEKRPQSSERAKRLAKVLQVAQPAQKAFERGHVLDEIHLGHFVQRRHQRRVGHERHQTSARRLILELFEDRGGWELGHVAGDKVLEDAVGRSHVPRTLLHVAVIVGRRARLVEGLGMHVGKGLGHRRLERSKHGLHRVSTAPRDVSADSDVDFRGLSGAALEQDILGAFQRGVELRGGGVDRDVFGLTHVDEPADRLHVAVA
mmetsp:Transcript_43957/g.104026  ORF Transcript_43957/g.104026 Transcript_43957/m.104026 type:complete len:232 (-) Transcript_43957:1519-2214(-)